MNNASGVKKFLTNKTVILFLLLILVIVIFTIVSPIYATLDNIRSIFFSCSLVGMMCCGMAPRLIGGSPDLSAGAIGMMGGIIVAKLLEAGMHWLPALVITCIAGIFCGYVNAVLVTKLKFAAFIATLAMSSVWQGLALVWTFAQNVPIADQSFWNVGGYSLFGFIPVPFIITVVMFIIYGIVLSSTEIGRKIYMTGGNMNAARLAGINIGKMHSILFCNVGLCAGFAGAVYAARLHTATVSSVIGQELTAITASVLGGVAFTGGQGNMVGAFIGILLLNFFNNGLVCIGLNSFWQITATGVLLLLALTIDFIRVRSEEKAMIAAAYKD